MTNYPDGVSPLGSKLLSKNKSIVPLRSQIEYVKTKLGHMQDKPTLESNLIFRHAAPKTHRGVFLKDPHQRLIDRFNSREGTREVAKEYLMPN